MIRIFRHYIPRWSLLLFLIETLLFGCSVFVGVSMRFLGSAPPDELATENLLPKALIFTLVMMGSMTATGRYQRLMEDGFIGELLRVSLSFGIGLFTMSLLFYAFPELFLGRGAFSLGLLFAMVAVLITRLIFFSHAIDLELLKRRIVIYGTGAAALRLGADVETRSNFVLGGYWPTATTATTPLPTHAQVITTPATLPEYCRANGIHGIVVTVDPCLHPLPISELLDCKTNGIQVMDLPRFFEEQDRLIHTTVITPEWWFFNSDGLYREAYREILKRLFDLGAALLLLGLTWPFMLLTALAIYLEGRGQEPVIYYQERVGFAGKPFMLAKFRSMRTDAEKDGVARWTQPNDSRVTLIGKTIRKTRIDELPQLFNVFKGEMSLVGPRPERPFFVDMLQEQLPYYRERLRVKPGITGWAQICYGYGSSAEDAAEKLKYDLYYVKNHSLFLDLLILFQSIEVVLFGRVFQFHGKRPP